jgi:predicted nucleotidyltransferase
MLPEFSPSIAPEMCAAINTTLRQIAADHGVRILFAVESGSRAWGFPSPDSDYDVRFVYAHRPDWYLSLQPGRDVIELPISDVLDVNGWDIRKALNLLIKPNPVLLEWLSSPVRYGWSQAADRLVTLSQRVAVGNACHHHYLHLAEGQWRRHIGEAEDIRYKKLFYVLRPALALRWLRRYPGIAPPMNLHQMCAGLNLSDDEMAEISRLLDLKSQSREIGTGPRIPLIDALIGAEFESARARRDVVPVADDLHPEAEDLFRAIVKEVW